MPSYASMLHHDISLSDLQNAILSTSEIKCILIVSCEICIQKSGASQVSKIIAVLRWCTADVRVSFHGKRRY